MTFDELFAEHNLTPDERMALVLHLATLRAMATVRTLLGPNQEISGARSVSAGSGVRPG